MRVIMYIEFDRKRSVSLLGLLWTLYRVCGLKKEKQYWRGFLRGATGKDPACQCRRRGFHSWVGKISWEGREQPTPAFLPGQSHGQRSLAGYSPWGRKELDTPEATQHTPLCEVPTV